MIDLYILLFFFMQIRLISEQSIATVEELVTVVCFCFVFFNGKCMQVSGILGFIPPTYLLIRWSGVTVLLTISQVSF